MTVPVTAPWPRIPYGEMSFPRIRRNGWLYVDKTRFLRPLEDERYAFFIRPRRFGKSCWLLLLECYYGRHWTHEFESLFGDTDIGRAPTAERGRYVVVRFDFSAFNDKLETLEERFEGYCFIELRHALERHPDLFPEAALRRILAPPAIDGRLTELFKYAGEHGIPLYILIDEYDNFANTVLAHRGREAYESFTHGGGFYRNFFAALKAGTAEAGGLERLFITGVSPITMDDVTSGFNIGKNVTLSPKFNDVLGFTEPEVRGLLELYRDRGAFNQDVDAALDVMREWYNGYRFTKTAPGDLYNTDMVLYYIKHSIPNEPMPDDLIDPNIRIDYTKLRHLLLVNRRASAEARRLNGNFDLLRHVIGEGEMEADDINLSFPLDELDEPENFLSLLYYLRAAEHPRGVGGRGAVGGPEPDGVAADVRVPAQGVPGRGGVLGEPPPLLGPGQADGLQGRVASGRGVHRGGHGGADGDSGLHRRREGGAGVPGGALQRGGAVPHPFGAGVEQGLRGPAPGALRGAVPGHRVRVRHGGEVPEAKRSGG